MNKKFFRFIAALLLIAVCLGGCKKNPVVNPGGGGSVNPGPNRTNITGIITNENNQPLSGVAVRAGASAGTTDGAGKFSLLNVPVKNGRVVVEAEKNGYFDVTMAGLPGKGSTTPLRLIMPERRIVASFHSATGATGLVQGNRIDIPANAVMTADGAAFNGAVQMAARYIDPGSSDLAQLMPGGDFQAVDKRQREVALYSYGAVEVELQTGAGQALQLKTGNEATITMDIAPGQLATAPATIPLWYFDTEKDKWVEEGFATRQGAKYVGKVKHFTSWNCDDPSEAGTVKGQIKKCDGSGLPFANVRVGQAETTADENGFYSVRVPADIPWKGTVTVVDGGQARKDSFDVAAVRGGETVTVDHQEKCEVALKGQVVNAQNVGVQATVILRSPTNSRFLTTDDEGRFLTQVAASTFYEIEASANGQGYPTRTINTPASGTMDLGKLQLQPATQGNSTLSFTVDGAVFNHQQFDYARPFLPGDDEGYFQISSQQTTLLKTFGDVKLSILFEGREPGAYPEAIISIHLPNNRMLVQAEDGSLVITKYEAVGGLIQGTFSGEFLYVDSSTGQPIATVNITNGRFTLHHTRDLP